MSDAPEKDETPRMPGVLRFYTILLTGFLGFLVGMVAHVMVG